MFVWKHLSFNKLQNISSISLFPRRFIVVLAVIYQSFMRLGTVTILLLHIIYTLLYRNIHHTHPHKHTFWWHMHIKLSIGSCDAYICIWVHVVMYDLKRAGKHSERAKGWSVICALCMHGTVLSPSSGVLFESLTLACWHITLPKCNPNVHLWVKSHPTLKRSRMEHFYDCEMWLTLVTLRWARDMYTHRWGPAAVLSPSQM